MNAILKLGLSNTVGSTTSTLQGQMDDLSCVVNAISNSVTGKENNIDLLYSNNCEI